MVKKLQLHDNFTEGFLLYAIASPLADYRMSFFINQKTGLQLKKYNDMPYGDTKTKKTAFSWYFYYDDNLNTNYYLIGNKSEGNFLISTLKQIDFFLLIKSSLPENAFADKIMNIRSVQQVYAILKQDFSPLPNMDLFLENVEMHELNQVVIPSKKSRYKQKK